MSPTLKRKLQRGPNYGFDVKVSLAIDSMIFALYKRQRIARRLAVWRLADTRIAVAWCPFNGGVPQPPLYIFYQG